MSSLQDIAECHDYEWLKNSKNINLIKKIKKILIKKTEPVKKLIQLVKIF
jgi:hypothetical protein